MLTKMMHFIEVRGIHSMLSMVMCWCMPGI